MKWFSSSPGRSLPLPALQGKIVEVAERNFKVEEHLGDGGFAVIYRVRDLNSNENFALKHVIMNSEETKTALREEAKIMKKVQGHPHVISLHSVAFGPEKDGQQDAYMIMDLCTESLFNLLQKSNFKLEDSQITNVFLSVCKAVEFLHTQKHPILHRDIKVENVLRRPNGNWVLCDFGSARSKNSKHAAKAKNTQDEQQDINRTTTPAYRAPEMWDVMMGQKVDEKADIWALGCMLYLLCYGTLPFTGESQLEVMAGKSSFPKTRSPRFSRIIAEMLNVEPSKRPSIEIVIALIETPLNQLPQSLAQRSNELTPEPTERRASSLTMGKMQTPEHSSAPPTPSRDKNLASRSSFKGDRVIESESRNKMRNTESPIPKIAAPKTSGAKPKTVPNSTTMITNTDHDEKMKTAADLSTKETTIVIQTELHDEVKALRTAVGALTENNQLLWSRILSLEKIVKSQEQIISELQSKQGKPSSVEIPTTESGQSTQNEVKFGATFQNEVKSEAAIQQEAANFGAFQNEAKIGMFHNETNNGGTFHQGAANFATFQTDVTIGGSPFQNEAKSGRFQSEVKDGVFQQESSQVLFIEKHETVESQTQELTVEVETPLSGGLDARRSLGSQSKPATLSSKTSGKFGGTFWKSKAAISQTTKINDNGLPTETNEDSGSRHKRVVSDPPPLDSWHPASGN
eukprot:g608.t1